MSVYHKYRDVHGHKTGLWFIKYPVARDPLTGKFKYKIEKVGYQKKLVEWTTNMRKAGVAPSVIMKMTGHKTAAMFNRYNTVDLGDAQEAYRKLQEFLSQEEQSVNHGKSRAMTIKCSHSAPGQRMG